MDQTKQKNKLLIVVIILLSCLLILTLVGIGVLVVNNINLTNQLNQNNQETSQDSTENETQENTETEIKEYSVISKTLSEETGQYSIDITYPQIEGLDNDVQDDFNEYVEDFAQNEAEAFKSEDFTYAVGKYSITYDFSVELKTENLLSILMIGDIYTGGAHGTPLIKTINYNIKDNALIELSEVIKPGSSLNQLAALVNQALKDQFDADMDESIDVGTTADEDNFKHFNFTENTFKITFDAYQVGPYVIGTPEIELDYSEVSNLMRDEILELLGL